MSDPRALALGVALALGLVACERPSPSAPQPSPPLEAEATGGLDPDTGDARAAAPRHSGPIAIDPRGRLLGVVNPDQDSASFVAIDVEPERVQSEVAVAAEPGSLTFAPDGSRAYVACARDAVVSVVDLADFQVRARIPVGLEPVALVVAPDGERAYVSQLADGTIGIVDLTEGNLRAEIEVPAKPHGLVLSGDGATLYVTHLIGDALTAIDLETRKVRAIALQPLPFDPHTPQRPAGVPNRMKAAALHPTTSELWLPAILSNSANFAQTVFDTTIFPALLVVDVARGQEDRDARMTLYSELQTVLSAPEALAFSSDGRRAYLVSSASDDLTVLDALQHRELRTLRDVAENPRGIALHPDGRRAYVFSRQVPELSVVDLARPSLLRRIEVSRPVLPPDVARGRRLFFTSALPEVSRDRFVGCGACHFDGREDGQTWFFDFGPRRTMTLEGGSDGKGLLHHNGDRRDVQDFQETIRGVQGGTGLSPEDLDHLAAFANSERIRFWRNPHRDRDGSLTPAAERGRRVFRRAGCADCHSGPFFTDASGHDDPAHPKLHDVGTFAPGTGRRDAFDRTRDQISTDAEPPRPAGLFEATSLLGVWSRPPYLHHGGAKTLLDALTTHNPNDNHGQTSQLSPEELHALVQYLKEL